MSILRKLIVVLFLFASFKAFSQVPVIKDTIKLKEVSIGDAQGAFKGIKRLDDVEGVYLYAGKKTELVDMQRIDANVAVNNTRQSFAKVPGLMIWENDGTGIQVGIATRGLSPNRSWEFNNRQNGYDIAADPFGYPEAYYTPAFEALEGVEFVRGAASLQFGPQFGGLVNYRFKKPNPTQPVSIESYQTAGSYGVFNSYTGISGTKGKWGYMGFFNHRNADGWRKNSRYNYNSGYGAVYYQINEKMKLKGEFTQMGFLSQQAGGLNDSLFAIDARASYRTRNWLHITWSMPAIDFDYAINENLSLNVKAFAIFGDRKSVGFTGNIGKANGDLNVDNMGARQVDADEYSNFGTEARFMYNYKLLGQNHNLAAGLRYYNGNTGRVRYIGTNGNDADFTNAFADSLQRDFTFTTQNIAAFAENVFRIGSKLTVSPGIRFEYLANAVDEQRPFIYNTSTARTFPLFGVGLGLATGKSTKLYGNFAQAYRPVLYGDITPAATSDVIDPNLKDAKGYTADLGWRGFIKNWLNFDVSTFYLQYNNRAGRITIANGSSSYQFVTNLNSSRTFGTEFYVELNLLKLIRPAKLAGLSVYASGTIQNAEYTEGLINGGTNTEVEMKGKKVEYAPSKIIRGGINYSYKSFSTSFQIAYTDKVFADANNTESSKTGNAGVVPAYTVADWSIGTVVKGHYVFKGGVNNIFNQRYYTRRAGGYPGPGILPGDGRSFFVTVGVKF